MLEDETDAVDDIDRHVRGWDHASTTPGSFSMNRRPKSGGRETPG
ncbi:hypothetical protein J2X72_004287 [Phyllobacterium sp. 1468]|nr:hypothetical protein [Phyllobacterium sp. 1468]MDR6635473.1 hypothetical protein [Phyllobacterium sp. 1468]